MHDVLAFMPVYNLSLFNMVQYVTVPPSRDDMGWEEIYYEYGIE